MISITIDINETLVNCWWKCKLLQSPSENRLVWMWKHTPVMPELKRWRQEDSEFKDSLDQKSKTVANKIESSEMDFFLLKKRIIW